MTNNGTHDSNHNNTRVANVVVGGLQVRLQITTPECNPLLRNGFLSIPTITTSMDRCDESTLGSNDRSNEETADFDRRDDHLAYSKRTGKTLYLPVNFIPISRGDGKIDFGVHTTNALVRFWRERYVETPSLTSTARELLYEDRLNCFHAQKSIRKEFRKLADSYVKARFVEEAISKFKFKKKNKQSVSSFDDCVEVCRVLFEKEGTDQEVHKNREIVWKYKYQTSVFACIKWEERAAREILQEHCVEVRDGENLVDGKKKCCFVKLMSVALGKIRQSVLVPKLIAKQPQQVYIAKDKDGNILKDEKGAPIKKRKRNQKKYSKEFDAEAHVVVDLTGDDETPSANKRVKCTLTVLYATLEKYFLDGGEPICSMNELDAILEGTPKQTSEISPRSVVENGRCFGDEGRPPSVGVDNNSDEDLDEFMTPQASDDECADVEQDGVVKNGDDDDEGDVEDCGDKDGCGEDGGDEDTVDKYACDEDAGKDDAGKDGSIQDGIVTNGVPKTTCNDCKLEMELSAYDFTDPQYWLHGLQCKGEKTNKEGVRGPCTRIFNSETVKRNEIVVVCRQTRKFQANTDERIRCCDVIYCMSCAPSTGRRRGK